MSSDNSNSSSSSNDNDGTPTRQIVWEALTVPLRNTVLGFLRYVTNTSPEIQQEAGAAIEQIIAEAEQPAGMPRLPPRAEPGSATAQAMVLWYSRTGGGRRPGGAPPARARQQGASYPSAPIPTSTTRNQGSPPGLHRRHEPAAPLPPRPAGGNGRDPRSRTSSLRREYAFYGEADMPRAVAMTMSGGDDPTRAEIREVRENHPYFRPQPAADSDILAPPIRRLRRSARLNPTRDEPQRAVPSHAVAAEVPAPDTDRTDARRLIETQAGRDALIEVAGPYTLAEMLLSMEGGLDALIAVAGARPVVEAATAYEGGAQAASEFDARRRQNELENEQAEQRLRELVVLPTAEMRQAPDWEGGVVRRRETSHGSEPVASSINEFLPDDVSVATSEHSARHGSVEPSIPDASPSRGCKRTREDDEESVPGSTSGGSPARSVRRRLSDGSTTPGAEGPSDTALSVSLRRTPSPHLTDGDHIPLLAFRGTGSTPELLVDTGSESNPSRPESPGAHSATSTRQATQGPIASADASSEEGWKGCGRFSENMVDPSSGSR